MALKNTDRQIKEAKGLEGGILWDGTEWNGRVGGFCMGLIWALLLVYSSSSFFLADRKKK